MKPIKKIISIALLSPVLMVLFSFSNHKGGEGFEVYLNSKLVLQQFGSQLNNVKNIQLDKSDAASQLSVKYFHCGQAGKNRSITIKDENNKILKEWHYPDVSAANLSITDVSMNFKVSDILNLQKSNTGRLNLYYSSHELPKGRLLATLVCETGMAKH
jgi:hypothetical protein